MRASAAARTSAPPGAPSVSAADAAGAVLAQAAAPAVRRAPRRPGPPFALPSSSPGGRAGAAAGAPSAGRRGERPAASDAATIDPAEVPTNASVRRRSVPVASSIPASTPVIQASPRTPPPARTRMSGSANTGTPGP